jgi:hypothetical protein
MAKNLAAAVEESKHVGTVAGTQYRIRQKALKM